MTKLKFKIDCRELFHTLIEDILKEEWEKLIFMPLIITVQKKNFKLEKRKFRRKKYIYNK